MNSKLAGALLATTLLASAGHAQLAVDFAPGTSINYGTSFWNLGFSFTANQNVTVVGLANWLGGAFPQDQQVGLWDSNGTLLASTLVSNSDPTIGTAGWKVHGISAVQLTAGQTYVVGGQGGADYTGLVDSVVIDPRISYGTDLFTYIGTSNDPLVEPMSTEGRPYGWFGGNVVLGSSAAPEPASWAMMLGGFGLVGAAMRRRRTAVRFA